LLSTMTSSTSANKRYTAAFVIVCVAFVLRLVWGVMVPVEPISDSQAYNELARGLAEHGVYGWGPNRPTALWAVGTSALYAVIYKAFGLGFAPIVALNIALGTTIVALTIRLGYMLFDEDTALLAGALMAIWPSQISYVTILASELPFIVLFLTGTIAWLDKGLTHAVRGVVSGAAFGAAAYFRPVALLLPIILWLAGTLDWTKMRRQLPMAILAMLIIFVTILPWSVRNSNIFGQFVLLSTNGGVTLWMGNSPDSDGYYSPLPAATKDLNEYEVDKLLGSQARDYILADPLAFIVRTIKKAALLHYNETIAVHWNADGIRSRFGETALLPLKIVNQGFWMAALLFALAGLGVLVNRNGLLATLTHPALLIWCYFSAVYAVTVISDRYHFPSHPLIAMLASVAILTGLQRFHWRPMGERA
jgi:hypothetical protein